MKILIAGVLCILAGIALLAWVLWVPDTAAPTQRVGDEWIPITLGVVLLLAGGVLVGAWQFLRGFPFFS